PNLGENRRSRHARAVPAAVLPDERERDEVAVLAHLEQRKQGAVARRDRPLRLAEELSGGALLALAGAGCLGRAGGAVRIGRILAGVPALRRHELRNELCLQAVQRLAS